MDDATPLESIERHFMAGCEGLDAEQLQEHRERGVCADCAEKAAEAAQVSRLVAFTVT